MKRGRFSIYHDVSVRETDSVRATFDIDGLVLVSR